MNLFVFPLSYGKLNTQAHKICYHNLGQCHHHTEKQHLPDRGLGNHTCCKSILVTKVIHSEQKRRNKCNHHKRHNTFAVDCIVNINTTLRGIVGHEKESLHTVEYRAQSVQLATLLEIGLNLIKIVSQKFHTTFIYFALKSVNTPVWEVFIRISTSRHGVCPSPRARCVAVQVLMNRQIRTVQSPREQPRKYQALPSCRCYL